MTARNDFLRCVRCAAETSVGVTPGAPLWSTAMAAVLLEELEPEIALITLNRPELLNAIDGTLLDALDASLDEVEASGEYRAVILTGSGRAFCAGADLSGTGEPWTKPARTAIKTGYDAQVRLADQMTRLYELSVPVIAAVNGAAVGGGLAYSLHCDVRIASESARFGSAFITAGFSSLDMGTSYLLPKIVGAGRAREMMLSGRIIDAHEAYRIGLVHEVVPQPDLIDAALTVARRIAANNEFGVWQTKLGLNVALDAPSLRHAKEIENRTQILAVQTGSSQGSRAGPPRTSSTPVRSYVGVPRSVRRSSPTTPYGDDVPDPLRTLLHDAARGTFPPGDFATTHLPSPSSPADAVLAFFGHHVIASDVADSFVQEWVSADPFALSDVRFLAALADRLDTTPGIYDAVFAALGEGMSPEEVGVVETDDRSHPRVVRALMYRDPASVRVFTDLSGRGMLVTGRGLAGRLEAAFEVDVDARGRGIGRTLVTAARRLASRDEPVFLQVSPGTVWSMRAVVSDSVWKPVGSEILFLRNATSLRVW